MVCLSPGGWPLTCDSITLIVLLQREGNPLELFMAAVAPAGFFLARSQKGWQAVTTSSTPWAWHATAQIGRIFLDFIETVTYRQGRFYRQGRVVTGPPGPEILLDASAMRSLLAELNDQREQAPPGTDVRALQAFIDLLSGALP